MPQLSNDCFAAGDAPVSIDDALALFRARIAAVAETELLPLQAVDNKVLAEDVRAASGLPPFDNSAVDGYAVRHADLADGSDSRLHVAGRLQAGDRSSALSPGTAVRIFTGAPLPAGADTVYMQEDVAESDGWVVLPPGLKRGANARPAGEEIAAGAVAIPAGRRLRPQDIALAAGVGRDRVRVRRPLRAAVFSTGNELIEPGGSRGPAQIFDTNRLMTAALLARLGVVVSDLGILKDEPGSLARALATAAEDHDLILTSGGVSTGEADFVKPAVDQVGRLDVWRFAIKPGRPLAMGTIGGAAFVGLPGNPVAVYVTFTHVVRGLIAALSGETWQLPLRFAVASGFSYRKKLGRTEFVRVHLEPGRNGELPTARKYARDGAGILSSLTETDAVMILGADVATIEPGDTVGCVPLSSYP